MWYLNSKSISNSLLIKPNGAISSTLRDVEMEKDIDLQMWKTFICNCFKDLQLMDQAVFKLQSVDWLWLNLPHKNFTFGTVKNLQNTPSPRITRFPLTRILAYVRVSGGIFALRGFF